MSASDDIWILGIHMTKFGKYPDKDVVDLASEAVMAALADAGVTMADIGILAAGNLMGPGGIGQQIQKQVGQTGIPVFNVSNACATGATALRTAIMAVKAGECDMGLAVGVEKLAGVGLLGAKPQSSGGAHEWTPKGRYGAVAATDGRIGTDNMPGVFAQVGMEYGHKYGGVDFDVFAGISEKNHAHSTLNPLAAYQKRFTLDEIKNDMMIAYPNTRPMCSANCDGAAAAVVVSGAKLKTLSLEQQRRAVKVSASILTSDPYQEACQVLPDVNTLTRNAAKQAYEQAGVGPERSRPRRAARLLRHRRARPLRQPDAVRGGRRRRLLPLRRHVARRHDAGQRVGRPAVEGPPDRGDRHRQHLGGLPPPPRRGRRPSDRGRLGRPRPRHRPRFGLRRPHPREVRPLTMSRTRALARSVTSVTSSG